MKDFLSRTGPCRPAAWLVGAIVVLAGCVAAPLGGEEPQAPAAPKAATTQDWAKALAEFNRAGALTEQYDYTAAAKAYENVLALAPDWLAARFNLGVAQFNLHGQQGAAENLDAARKTFEAVLAVDPKHRHARFCLGLYHQHMGDNDKAVDHFLAVQEADPADPFVAYKCAETLLGLGRNDEGTVMLEKAVAIDPGFISAIYRLALQYQRKGRRDEAARLFDRFKRLNEAELSGGTYVVQKTYGTAGKYYRVLGADNLPLPPAAAADVPRVVFSPEVRTLEPAAAPWPWSGGTIDVPGVAVGDVDGDGDLDLCLTGLGKDGPAALWLNDGKGGFTAGAALAARAVSPCFGDVDNDGDLDLWIGCAGPDVLLTNDGKGAFKPATPEGVAGPDTLTACARLADMDSDGDLDLLALRLASGSVPARGKTTPAPSSVFNNNRDGTCADVAATLGLAMPDTPVAAVVYDDFDDDRDLDLVIFPAGEGRPIAWVNDRAGAYHVLDSAATGLDVGDVTGATSGDPDKDGDRDLLVFAEDGVRLFVNQGGFRFASHAGFAAGFGPLGGTSGQFADIDNDGDLDIVIADARRRDGTRGPALLLNDSPRDRFLDASAVDPGCLLGAIRTEGPAGCVVADFTGNGRCDILLAAAGAKPVLIRNVTPGGHWIALDILGTRTQDNKSRSNGSAIGARVEVKAGRVVQQFVVGVPSGPVAMPPLRIHCGLGDAAKVEWLRIVWPDGVLQAELELPADVVTTVTEMSRKTSSCPYLFAWNGTRFEFIADFAGVGGLGYLAAPGVYAPPDPTEYLPVPQLAPRDGEYVLQVLEPLEEVAYIDEAKLIAVDHPAGTTVHPNELMAIGVPPPAFEVFCVGDPIEPVRAVNDRGQDVTDALARIDRHYADPGRLDPRFVGLAEDHFVELDFGDRLKAVPAGARLVLFLYGWVEYGYSATNYAASQAGLVAKAPSIHVERGGKWVELFHEAGYPAGLNHMMTLEVTGKLLPTDRKIRLSDNMELYWDRIFLGLPRGPDAIAMKEVPVRSADLHFLGYPREYSPDGHHPNLYDYGNIDTAIAWKLMTGWYTRFGEVGELLGEADDCYVIMGRGEELTLRFPADALGPVPPGMQRSFILKADSFCKDMDLYTAYPDTVEPLPFHGMSGYPYGPDEHYPDTPKTRAYRQQFNTRHISGQ
ncbi:MAG: VCBS repeat-containing protein [Planctomycetes bacterium]|nr:VCBS repeat-containing protein [Planctomycetota bacterium]